MRGFLRLLGWAALTVLLVVAAAAGAGYWLHRDLNRPGPLVETRAVVIPARSGVAEIASLLTEQGVIRHSLPFELGAAVSGRGTALKAGEYEFPARVSALEAMDIIAGGKTVKHRLTIPEGLTNAEILAMVQAAPELEGETGPPPAEGGLMPDT